MQSGSRRDMTGAANLKIEDPKIADLDDSGIVRGKRDGMTLLTGMVRGRAVRIPVVVSGFTKTRRSRLPERRGADYDQSGLQHGRLPRRSFRQRRVQALAAGL